MPQITFLSKNKKSIIIGILMLNMLSLQAGGVFSALKQEEDDTEYDFQNGAGLKPKDKQRVWQEYKRLRKETSAIWHKLQNAVEPELSELREELSVTSKRMTELQVLMDQI